MNKLKNSELICFIFYTALSIIFYVQIRPGTLVGEIIPLVCIGIFMICAVISLKDFVKKHSEIINFSKYEVLGLSFFGIYLILINYIGFYIASPIFCLLIFGLMNNFKAKYLGIGFVFGAVLVACVHFIFVELMYNILPQGVWLEEYFL